MTWLAYAFISALGAAATAILVKLGVEGIPSTLATALRTLVVLLLAWAIAIGIGEHRLLPSVSRRALLFLGLSGVATAISWLAYFRALQLAPVSWVAPVDKLSLPLTVLLAFVWLEEPLTWRLTAGVALMVAGAAVTRL